MKILSGHFRSIFQDFEKYLRTENNLVEDDIRLVLDEINSSVITYETQITFKVLKIFPKSFLTYFNLNINDLVT